MHITDLLIFLDLCNSLFILYVLLFWLFHRPYNRGILIMQLVLDLILLMKMFSNIKTTVKRLFCYISISCCISHYWSNQRFMRWNLWQKNLLWKNLISISLFFILHSFFIESIWDLEIVLSSELIGVLNQSWDLNQLFIFILCAWISCNVNGWRMPNGN